MGNRSPGLKEWARAQLPTPTAGDAMSAGNRNLPGSKAHKGTSLTDAVRRRVLPTPDARCWKSGTGRKDNGHSPQLEAVVGGQLSVPFVEQMMGLPTRWTALPDSLRSAMRRSRSKRPPPSAS